MSCIRMPCVKKDPGLSLGYKEHGIIVFPNVLNVSINCRYKVLTSSFRVA